MARTLLVLFCIFGYGVAAANNDDGFVWVDANTKIRIKPVGAAGGATKAPEPKKEEKKKDEPKK